MGRFCSVCSHAENFEINRLLVLAGDSNRRIATQYGLSEAAIRRHKEHFPRLLVKGREAEEACRADDLVGQARTLQGKTLQLLEDAEEEGDTRTALTAIREARGNLELMAKLLEVIKTQPEVNILVHPQWVAFRTTILAALELHPQAREDVMRAIEEAGGASS